MGLFGRKKEPESAFTRVRVSSATNAEYQQILDIMWNNHGIGITEVSSVGQTMYMLSYDFDHLKDSKRQDTYNRLRGRMQHGYLKRPVLSKSGTVQSWTDGPFSSKTEALEIGLKTYMAEFARREIMSELDDKYF